MGRCARKMMASVDETDRAILSALRENSRQAFVELAKIVGVSERTIRTRVRRLEEDGIIRGYTIRETGIGLTALIRMKVGPGVEIGSLAGEFANWKGVESVYEISGEADLVAAGDSCLDGKLGEMIGDPLVTVLDDPTWEGGHGSFPVDDEGLDTASRTLIENGRLVTYLNHRETAAHFDIPTNGAARAQDGLHHPLVRMSNTMIMGGKHEDLDELLEDVQDGVYACGTRGGQVDTGRGSFQFAAQEAWRIRDGELAEPLKDVSVSGMTLSILKNVDGLTKNAVLASPGFCGKGQMVPVGDGGPAMRIRDALVG